MRTQTCSSRSQHTATCCQQQGMLLPVSVCSIGVQDEGNFPASMGNDHSTAALQCKLLLMDMLQDVRAYLITGNAYESYAERVSSAGLSSRLLAQQCWQQPNTPHKLHEGRQQLRNMPPSTMQPVQCGTASCLAQSSPAIPMPT